MELVREYHETLKASRGDRLFNELVTIKAIEYDVDGPVSAVIRFSDGRQKRILLRTQAVYNWSIGELLFWDMKSSHYHHMAILSM
tara:strand:- start:86 stop:340 length:255 start_codon:yes stop_codon:yes gene_type:complete